MYSAEKKKRERKKSIKKKGREKKSRRKNVLTQSTAKVAMGSRFLGFVGSLPLDEQKIWLPNQSAQDPQTG